MLPSFHTLLKGSQELRAQSYTIHESVKESVADSRNAVARAKAIRKSILILRQIKLR
jgi:hypothetical protein